MNKSKFLIIGIVASALVVTAVVFFLDSQKLAVGDSETVKIGAVVHLTGPSAQLGAPLKNGMLTAVEFINSGEFGPGSSLKLEIQDSKNTANGTISAFNLLATKGVSGIVSTGDIEYRAINAVANDAELPIIGTSCTGGIDGRSKWVFRYCYSEQSQDRDLSEFLVNELGHPSVTLLFPNNEYGSDIKFHMSNEFQNAGGTNFSSFPYDPGSGDQRSLIQKVLSTDPEVLCIRGFGTGFESTIRQAREEGFSGLIVGDVTLGLPSTLTNNSSALEGSYYVASELDLDSDSLLIQKYIESYRNMFDAEPSFWDALGFDSIVFMWEALKSSETNVDTRVYLNQMELKNGLLGLHGFDEKGDLEFKTSVFLIKNGKPQLYKK